MSEYGPIIESKAELTAYLEGGSKPDRSEWRIGSEHEKFIFHRSDNAPLAYNGTDGRPGVQDVLNAFVERGWNRIDEGDHIIAAEKNGASITLEPGGQFELSGAPLETLHETCNETSAHLRDVKAIGEALGIGFLGLGFHPTLRREDVPVMPKGRYDIMRAYMPTKGSLGLDMMLRTCTVQVNLDFADEADMVEKFRLSLALQPLATALFANSPFKEGVPNGMKSYRSHIWTDTDPDRCGMLPFVFEQGMGFERYTDYLLDVPMYFVKRDNKYINAAGQSFRDFMAGKLPALPGEKPTMEDFKDHMTTAFPEVRLKRYLEMRGADAGPWSALCALPAFWVGLLYDTDAQSAAYDLVKDWTVADMEALRADTPAQGLAAKIHGRSLQDLSLEVLKIADGGLKARNKASSCGETEQGFLSELFEIARSGKAPADILMDRYNGEWGGDVTRVFAAFAY